MSESFNLKSDHYSFTVKDLERSAAFYRDVLRLQEIENKTQKAHIRWFGLEDAFELHLIEGDTDEIQTIQRIHMAFKTEPALFDDLLARLEEHGIPFASARGKQNTFNVRPDGVRQIYFQDPDAYWIEVNDASQ